MLPRKWKSFFPLLQIGLVSHCGPMVDFTAENTSLIQDNTLEAREAFAFSNEFSHLFPEKKPFTIIALPDTQVYSDKYPEIFEAQTRWIADNKERLNIIYVFHLGDIVETPEDVNEWNNASQAMSRLDGVIPYGVLPGNHDMNTSGVAENYNTYFPVTKFAGETWWGGSYLDNKNNYQLLTAGGIKWIMINLEFEPPRDVLAWARDVLQNHSDRIGILATHSFLWKGFLYTSKESWRANGTNSVAIQEEVVAQTENLMMILSAHYNEEGAFGVTRNAEGEPVFALASNYQSLPEGGSGYLKIIQFFPAKRKIRVRTYSPWLEFHNKDSELPVYKTEDNTEFEICLETGALCFGETRELTIEEALRP